MININGKEWGYLESTDIQEVLSKQDFDESFYFELKSDSVAPKKIIEEISAFANTFGGYIFIGILDDKRIEGCTSWNEQRIHTTIHDSITPTPAFDVKKFICDAKTVYVIKIEEGAEPPYITSSGRIYERLSSGSFVINDSVRLSQIYNKREQLLAKVERKISIPPIAEKTNNIYGYIDVGFSLVSSDRQEPLDIINKVDLKTVANNFKKKMESFNLVRVGTSIVYIPGGLYTKSGYIPASANNFLEIMADGSAKMRVLLLNNDPDDSTVNMLFVQTLFGLYREVYSQIFGKLYPDKMIYAKKFESLTLIRQFQPTRFYSREVLELHPDWEEDNEKMHKATQSYQKIVGVDTVVSNDRIPKTGLYTIDKRNMEKQGLAYTSEAVIDELFFSRFACLGISQIINEDEMNT